MAICVLITIPVHFKCKLGTCA